MIFSTYMTYMYTLYVTYIWSIWLSLCRRVDPWRFVAAS